MKKIYIYFLIVFCVIICASCSVGVPNAKNEYDRKPCIYPDYTDVTIPHNIAPLRFQLKASVEEAVAVLSCGSYQLVEKADDSNFLFSMSDWRKLMEYAKGSVVDVKLYEKVGDVWSSYLPFQWEIAEETIDDYLVYRLIPPGYELWYEMGIYQRNVTSWEETPIITNKKTDNNCINCHSFCRQSPDKMLFHMRESHGGTYIWNKGKLEKVSGKIADNIPSLVYPYWHPSGEYVAFSTNTTTQMFHMGDRNRIEVYDVSSDLLVYDLNSSCALTDSLVFSKDAFETFPTFSPDGRFLYFCSSKAQRMPEDYKKVKYDICRIEFDPESRKFGQKVDTLVHASQNGQSAVFPRISPDGRFLVFCKTAYGNFTIWHKDADLWILNLETGQVSPMTDINSEESESYHCWSQNGAWMVFASRREDGLYTRPYITHITKQGKASKPFVLPQEYPEFYLDNVWSYNIPELVVDEIELSADAIVKKALGD